MKKEWFTVDNVEEISSPALLLYRNRIENNIRKAVEMADAKWLRPHVKTNKTAEVCQMMMAQGIGKFKCATIAEAEMLARAGAQDVLLAYPLVGPNLHRFIALVSAFPFTNFSCLVDSLTAAGQLIAVAGPLGLIIGVFVDLNTGMNRTGVATRRAKELIEQLLQLPQIRVRGLHAYDGQVTDSDLSERQRKSDETFAQVDEAHQWLPAGSSIVMGGSPTLPVHAKRYRVECSPGTFVFWDYGYGVKYPDEPFEYAALVLTRVISIVDERHICVDLGYKSVASEMPLPRVHFLNVSGVEAVAHSEEHLTLRVTDSSAFLRGHVLYGVPAHICPTVALYGTATVIDDHRATDEWVVTARNRKIGV